MATYTLHFSPFDMVINSEEREHPHNPLPVYPDGPLKLCHQQPPDTPPLQ